MPLLCVLNFRFLSQNSSTVQMTRAGLPATTVCFGTDFVTMAPFSNGHSRHYLRSASDVGKIFDCDFPESVVVGHFVVQHARAAMGVEMYAACDSDIVSNFDQVGLGGDEDVAVDVAIVAYFHSHAAKRPDGKEFEQKMMLNYCYDFSHDWVR